MTSDYKDYRIIKGILNQDEIWEGKILIPAPLKIPRGVKVRVLPGTEIILSGLSVEKKDQKGIGAIEKYNK
ncbi:MAG: hypothetical protein GX817_04365, partial [Elusimicrobia bacterium]|nr:hypothetical protein [Elusimicrobiota bacterium]